MRTEEIWLREYDREPDRWHEWERSDHLLVIDEARAIAEPVPGNSPATAELCVGGLLMAALRQDAFAEDWLSGVLVAGGMDRNTAERAVCRITHANDAGDFCWAWELAEDALREVHLPSPTYQKQLCLRADPTIAPLLAAALARSRPVHLRPNTRRLVHRAVRQLS